MKIFVKAKPSIKKEMVENQLVRRGITDQRVLAAMLEIPREKFVPAELREFAYNDCPLPIGFGQTISQPYIVAYMCQLLELTGVETVLDIGTGSGYQAAVLGQLARAIISIERINQLGKAAKQLLQELGYSNIRVIISDGNRGYQAVAPYNAIISAATVRRIPKSWKNQLADNGRIIAPVFAKNSQNLILVTRQGNKFLDENFGRVEFVPLIKGIIL